MGRERRRSPRADVNLLAGWETDSTSEDATVTNLSVTGCFVLSAGELKAGDMIRIRIMLSDESEINPQAAVVDAATEIGFAVAFTSMEDDDTKRLEEFVKRALETS